MIFQIVLFTLIFSLTIRNIFMMLFSLDMYSGKLHKKRLKQLKFTDKKDDSLEEKIISIKDTITKPVIDYLLPYIKIRDIDELERDLKLGKWDQHINAMQYIAMSLILKVVGVIYFIFRLNNGTFFGVTIGLILFFGMEFFLRNSIEERVKKLLVEFPDFIRMIDVYLSSGLTYQEALVQTIKFMDEEWQYIMEKMIVEASRGDIVSSLDVLLEEFNIVDVKEFVALVKLNYLQGGNLSEAFNSQADKVKELYIDAKEIQIEKRKMWGTLLQLPILVALFVAFGLPMVGEVINFL